MVDCGGLGSDHGNGFRLNCFRHPTGVYSSKHAELHGSELVVAYALSQPRKRLSSLRDGAELRFDVVRLFPPLSTAFDAYGGACERGMRGSRESNVYKTLQVIEMLGGIHKEVHSALVEADWPSIKRQYFSMWNCSDC